LGLFVFQLAGADLPALEASWNFTPIANNSYRAHQLRGEMSS